MYTCCNINFSSQLEYNLHRHNRHFEWPEKPYRCEGHPMDEDGKPIGNRTILYKSEYQVFKHEFACLHNKQYLCMMVGDMSSAKVDRPPQQVNQVLSLSTASLVTFPIWMPLFNN